MTIVSLVKIVTTVSLAPIVRTDLRVQLPRLAAVVVQDSISMLCELLDDREDLAGVTVDHVVRVVVEAAAEAERQLLSRVWAEVQ
jgi:hypothetical protein